MAMFVAPHTTPAKLDRRVAAVLALFRGEPAAQVSAQFGICRSDLYKFRARAFVALRAALADHPRGPKRPHNRLDAAREQTVVSLCQRYPTWSAYQVRARLGPEAPSPRTIQRVRQRRGLVRLPKRASPSAPRRRLSAAVKERAMQLLNKKRHLGPERLAWDLQNGERLQISPSTMKRFKRAIHEARHPRPAPPVWRFYERKHPHSLWHGDCFEKVTLPDGDRTAYQLTLLDDYSRAYVFCDLFREVDVLTTIRALIAAMRQYQTIPKGVVFDNGSPFSGFLLAAFCDNLGIRLMHTAVRHPQTNGKLERAFRDDRREYYNQCDAWIFDALRAGLPEYVRYRNEVRGHHALQGKPTITRLQEQHYFALPAVLDRLESFARYEIGTQKVDLCSGIRVLGRNGYLSGMRYKDTMRVFETLDGLEAHAQDGRIFLLRDYRKYRQMFYDPGRKGQLPFSFRFEALNFTPVLFNARRMIMRGEEYIKPARNRPRIAVAQ